MTTRGTRDDPELPRRRRRVAATLLAALLVALLALPSPALAQYPAVSTWSPTDVVSPSLPTTTANPRFAAAVASSHGHLAALRDRATAEVRPPGVGASPVLLAADPACAELNARGAHRPSPWVPSSPRDTHSNRRCPSQPDNETKHLVPSAHPSPVPFPHRFPQTQRPREAASSTAAAPSSSAATTSPARTSSRSTARTFASPTSRAPRCARRNSGALTSRARTS